VRIQKESNRESDEDGEIEIEESVDDVKVLYPVTDGSVVINNVDTVATRASQGSLSERKIPVSESQRDHSHRMDSNSLSDDKACDTRVKSTKERLCEDIDVSEECSENSYSLALVSDEKNFMPKLKEGVSELSSLKYSNEGKECGKGTSYSVAVSHQDILESIFNLPPPMEELVLDVKTITEEEKVIHAEFFEGRSAKTPKRYLKVSVHLLTL
jgi:hypothetical protein